VKLVGMFLKFFPGEGPITGLLVTNALKGTIRQLGGINI
jgi:hypothetical protein